MLYQTTILLVAKYFKPVWHNVKVDLGNYALITFRLKIIALQASRQSGFFEKCREKKKSAKMYLQQCIKVVCKVLGEKAEHHLMLFQGKASGATSYENNK